MLVFGTYDTRVHPRVGVLAEGLSKHGVEVRECNEPLGFDTAARVAMLRRPWRLPGLLVRLAACWVTLARRARHLPPADAVLVGYMGHFDVLLARRLFPARTIVLDHLIGAADTARDRGRTGSTTQWLLRALDHAALRSADLVLVDTEEHRELLPSEFRDRAVVVPVGAPAAWFDAGQVAEAHGSRPEAPLRVVFFGLFTPLQGAQVIGRALNELAADPIDITMVGRGQDYEAARAAAHENRRIRWVEWVDATALPELVAQHDVCLGIFGNGAKALRVVPNKVFQGAAAGCAIVTSDTPPQRRLLGDAAVFVPPGDAQALAVSLRRLMADRQALASLRQKARMLARTQFGADRVVIPILERLQDIGHREASA